MEPLFIRVRDTSTGYEYDVRTDAVIPEGVVVLEKFPPNLTREARPANTRVQKGSTAHSEAAKDAGSSTPTTKPSLDGTKEK